MFNFFCKILQHPKINPGSAPDTTTPLVANFSKTTALSSKKFVCEQDMSISDLSKKFRFFGLNSSAFALGKQPGNPNFHSFFISFLVALLRFRKTT